jgi:large subunit ribosomal protein L22
MLAQAISKYVRTSPYKLRPYVDVIRGNRVDRALAWLKTCSTERIVPIQKTVFSAYSNAKSKFNVEDASMEDFFIKEIRVDQGPTVRYFKPSAMGRASSQTKRMCHVLVVVEKRS